MIGWGQVGRVTSEHRQRTSLRVVRGPDWKWSNQDHGGGGVIVGDSGARCSIFHRRTSFLLWALSTLSQYTLTPAASLATRVATNGQAFSEAHWLRRIRRVDQNQMGPRRHQQLPLWCAIGLRPAI